MIDKLIQAVRDESYSEATRLLYGHWSEKCPKLYSGPDDEPWINKVDEDTINKELLAPLAAMYVLDEQETLQGQTVSLKPLTEKVGIKNTARKPGQLCGRMFKNGDPTYTCKECALDETCVLCHECFKQSVHAKHRYKMHSSSGGGYCDCGDKEAWSKDYACKLHTSEPQPGDEDLNFSLNLPVEVSSRIYNVTGIVLKYAVTLICWQDDESLPSFLHEPTTYKPEFNHRTMLFNDETHTYDAVINALELAIGCTSQQAMHLATIVDREGRAVVLSNTLTLCSAAKKTIQHRTKRDISRRTEKSGPLEVKIMTASLVSHQALAVKLLNWLTQQAQEFPVIARVFAEVIMKECSSLCKLDDSDLAVPIPPPKPPRQMGVSDEEALIQDAIENMMNEEALNRIQAQLFIRGNEDEAELVVAPFVVGNNEAGGIGIGRPRTFPSNQIPARSQKVPKFEKKFIVPANNKLPCGHLTSCTQLSLCDRKLWKSARMNFHHLLMATVLMDLEHKLNFGVFMIRNYEFLYQDFIDDDHEYNVSVVAMSVQVLTVTSVALHLIEHENALAIIFETIKQHCHQYLKFLEANERYIRCDFTNSSIPAVLRRALIMFKDSLYLLCSTVPPIWTSKMRQSFINGFEVYVDFLTTMQSMDGMRRQIDQHQMIEAEWETAFHIQLNIQEITSMLIIWAKSDPYVHQRAVKLCIDRMLDIASCSIEFECENCTHIDEFISQTIGFNVSKDYVSVHQPVWRLFGGLFTAPSDVLKNYVFSKKLVSNPDAIYLDKDIQELMDAGWNNSEPISNVYIWPLHVILEMPLRVIVLEAQCNAQLWRRNGYALVNQVHNYTAPLCRAEMFDRDLQTLQICAAKMNPTEFLIRCLERFNLERWAGTGFEDQPLKQHESTPSTSASTPEELSKIVVNISEEFLHLLIMIIGERFVPGIGKVTQQQHIQREIIHLLCTGPKTYSHVEKAILIEPHAKVLGRDEALNHVADFHKPASTAAGTFKLKETFKDQYNPFYYHYTKQQSSQAEQFQWREREKAPRHIKACPPPILPDFEEFYEPILKLIENPLFIRLLTHVVNRFVKRSRYSSESLFHRGLFLIGMSLNEQLTFYKRTPRREFSFVDQAERVDIFNTLKELSTKPEAEAHHNLIFWILDKYNEIKELSSEKVVPSNSGTTNEPENETPADAKDKLAKKKALAAKKREQAMKAMQKMQKTFVKVNALAVAAAENDKSEFNDNEEDIEYSVLAEGSGFPVCLGPKKSNVILNTTRSVKCILCQETEQLSYKNHGKSMVCCAFLQNSKMFAQKGTTADDLIDATDTFTASTLLDGYNISTCSHTMHYECFKQFSEALWSKDRTRTRGQMLGQHIIDADSHEYLCPLCKRLSNVALPLLPSTDRLQHIQKFSTTRPSPPEPFDDWLSRLMTLARIPADEEKTSTEPSKNVKTHSRKRSHSERSLLDLTKPFSEGFVTPSNPSLSSSQPSVTPMSPNSAETPTSPQPRGASEPIDAIHNPIIPEEWVENAILHAAQRFIEPPGLLNKIKSVINKPSKSVESSSSWMYISNVLKPCLKLICQLGPEVNPLQSTPLSEVTRFYQATAFVLRSITTTLKVENKPLFGALNTRQRDCVLCLSRMAAVASLNLHQGGCRLLTARLLTPLLVPRSELNASTALPLPPPPPIVSDTSTSAPESLRRSFLAQFRAGRNAPGTSSSQALSPSSSSPEAKKTMVVQPSPTEVLQSHIRDEINILNIDLLSVAVGLAMNIGCTWSDNEQNLAISKLPLKHGVESKVPDGSVDELYSIYLCLLAYIFQNMASFPLQSNLPEDVEMVDAEEEPSNSEALHTRLRQLLSGMSKVSNIYSMLDLKELEMHLTDAVVNFLQPIALLYHGITLIPPPDSLKHTSYNEFESLCRYLGLPSHLEELLEGSFVDKLFEQWTEHLDVYSQKLESIPRQPIRQRNLVQLPYEFTDLITDCAAYRCPSLNANDLATSQPTMCLICGKIMCSQSYCCQQTLNDEKLGACSYHMRECSGKSGIFLRIRDCQIVLLAAKKRGAIKPAPYVDQFGETDNGFRRGNPLFLHPEMYRRFQRLWLHQEIAEEVINQYDFNHRNINFEWNHF